MNQPIEQAGNPSDGRPTFQERLRVERERLGMSQEAFGMLGGVSKASQWMYEQGRHWPTTEYLESLRQHRVDVGYLATGIRQDTETLRHALGFVLTQCVISYKSNALLGLGLTRADSALPFINAVVADSKAGPTLHRSAELAKQIYADTSGQLLVY